MNPTKVYVDLRGRAYSLADLDAEEQALVRELIEHAGGHGWNEYGNFWMPKVGEFYAGRGLSRQETLGTAVYRIARDLENRLGVAQGSVRLPDYRDHLAELVRTRFRTQREFCEATGISEDMLSHVLAGRKHLAIDTLTEALARIGYTLLIAPTSEAKAS